MPGEVIMLPQGNPKCDHAVAKAAVQAARAGTTSPAGRIFKRCQSCPTVVGVGWGGRDACVYGPNLVLDLDKSA